MTTLRMERVQSPMIPIVGEWTAQHPGTISLGQGVVHYPPPAQVTAACVSLVRTEPRCHRYGMVRGIPELIEPLWEKLSAENRIHSTTENRLVVTAGSNMAFVHAILAIADVDDEIVLIRPHYFNHEMAIQIAGCRVVSVPAATDYQLDEQAIARAIGPRTRAVVTVSPCNPTGAVYRTESLARVNALCRERGVYHISDEAYEYFLYDDVEHFSPGSLPDAAGHTISLFSFSKAYGMAGWRVGYMVIPSALEMAVKKIQDTNLVCPPILNQFVAQAALEAGRGWCAEQIAPFAAVRDLVCERLADLGARCHAPRPGGAFYVLAELDTDKSDLAIVEPLIRQYGVAVLPGSTFAATARCTLRIAFGALDQHTVAEGMGRLVRGLQQLM